MRERVRQRQIRIAANHFVLAVEAAHQVDVEGSRSPFLQPDPIVVPLQGLGPPKPAVRVGPGIGGEHDGVEEPLLLHPAPGIGLEDR